MTPRRALRAALAAALLAAPSRLAAQLPRDTVRLDSLVVTATRLPVPRTAVASAATVVTAEGLRVQGVSDLLEALRGVPGATVVQGGSFGTPASLFLRGGESDYVKVLVDGVAVNEPGGGFDFAHLTVDDVARIEIVRGPASVLYGSDAVAGVVQVFTRPGRGAPRWQLAGGAGTHGSSRLEAGAAGGTDRLGFSLSASRFGTDGTYAFNSGYRRYELAGRLRAALGGRTDAALTLRLDDHVTHFPTDGAGRVVDRNQFTTGRLAALGLEARQLLGPRLELRLQLGATTSRTGYDDRPDGPTDTVGFYADVSGGRTTRRSADLRAVAYLATGTTLTVGGALESQAGRSCDSSASQYGPFVDALAASRRTGALYAQLLADPGRRVALTAGARADRDTRFGAAGTWRVGLAWRLAAGARIRAAIGTALKEPTFYEIAASGFVVGNPALRPERSRSWEVGAEAGLGRHGPSVAATWFHQRFTDLIQYTAVPPAAGQPNYFNVAAAEADGVESELSLGLPGGLTVRGHYTYLRTAVRDAGFETADDGPFAVGRPLLRRPAHAAGVSLTRAGRALTLWVGAEFVGRRDDMDYAAPTPVRVVMPAHLRADAAAGVPLAGRAGRVLFSATVRVENLTDARFQDVRGFPARGRTVFVGLRAEGGAR